MKRLFLMAVLLVGGFSFAHAQDAASAQAPAQPQAAEPAPDQPIPFSHKKHVQVAKAACGDCHVPNRSGASLSIPQASTCMLCHSAIATDKPDIQRLAAIAKSGDTIPWARVYQVPSFVNFSHKLHTEHGKTCQECHGDMGQTEVTAKVSDISMGGCISCHQKNNAAAACDTCHELQAGNRPMRGNADEVLLARLGLVHPPMPHAGSALQAAWVRINSSAPAAQTSSISRYLGTLAMLPLAR